jgi:hypothetical protein
MASKYQNNKINAITCICIILMGSSCKKLVAIAEPTNTITTTQVFNTETEAEGALVGLYTRMINGASVFGTNLAASTTYSAGLSTILGGLSSDELFVYEGAGYPAMYAFNTNKVTVTNSAFSDGYWKTAYTIIYGANSVIEGIAASRSAGLSDSTRKALTGEAKFVRAFSYYYLLHFFGEVPLALTVDFNKTVNLPRASKDKVYAQIVQDLQDAQAALPAGYPVAKNGRGRPNKWAATALLARVYLQMGNNAGAALAATEVIGQSDLYVLEPSLKDVFVTTSREAIWQLQQTSESPSLRNATPEGIYMIPGQKYTSQPNMGLTAQLLQAFEPGDHRRTDWVDSTDGSYPSGVSTGITRYPAKYKTGGESAVFGAPVEEYYVVLRLAEMYLIRAEAEANGAPGGTAAAIADLNIIRHRAGLNDLSASLTSTQVTEAVAQERQIELFAEWGHRWLDLKRTGRAHDVLSAIPLKQPWAGDHQLLYPIPASEILNDHFLIQNKDY